MPVEFVDDPPDKGVVRNQPAFIILRPAAELTAEFIAEDLIVDSKISVDVLTIIEPRFTGVHEHRLITITGKKPWQRRDILPHQAESRRVGLAQAKRHASGKHVIFGVCSTAAIIRYYKVPAYPFLADRSEILERVVAIAEYQVFI